MLAEPVGVVRERRRRPLGGAAVLPDESGLSGLPLPRSQARTVSPWLARPTASTGSPRGGQRRAPGLEHGGEQLLRILLDGAARAVRRPDAAPSAARARRAQGDDDQRLRAGGALVDRQDDTVHHRPASSRSIAGASLVG